MPESRGAEVSGERPVFVGREAALRALDGWVETPGLVLVRGDAGVGKTALLGEFRKRAQARGIRVVSFDRTDTPEWDEFGTVPVIASVREGFPKNGDPRLAAALAAVVRGSSPGTYSSGPARSALFADLLRLLFCFRGDGAIAVLADDVDAAPNSGALIGAAHQAGCAVVVACRADAATRPSGRVLDLAPLSEDEVARLLAALARRPLDEAVAPAVRRGLGSLAGNAGTVSAVFGELVRDGRFAEVQGYLCLADPDRPITLPSGHVLVRHVTRTGEVGAQLVVLAHRMDRFGVDDLPAFAAATGRDLDTCGLVVDDLVTAGVLESDHEGQLSVPCPAVVPALHRAVAEDVAPAQPSLVPAVPAGSAAVHRAVAEYLMRPDSPLPAEPAVVAEHIALAGPALRPDRAVVVLLEREATRVRRHDLAAAARWSRAALWHCVPASATHSRVLGIALRLLIRVGDYRCLGEVVVEAVAAGFEEAIRYELAVAAALAAVHLGGPVPEPVRTVLATEVSGRAPLDFAAAFDASGYAFDGEQFEATFVAFHGDESLDAWWGCALEQAGDQHDILTLIRLLVGPGYGEPEAGPMAVFGRMTRNFTRGQWAGILSDARRLELDGGTAAAIRQFTRMIAAETYSALGEPGRATQWLEKVSADLPFRAIRTWVEIGIAYRGGDWDRARERGWAVYPDIVGGPIRPGDLVGLRWFLVRMAYLEKQAGNVGKLQVLCRDAKLLHARYPGVTLRIAELILRGLAENDAAAATEAVEILRGHGNRPELMRALITVAFLADDPRPWYREAYEIAQQLGGDWLLASVTASMRENGIAAPSQRSGVVALTGDEERIIGLIQQGLTNRQIAAAVQVSEKTVESYLTKLFGKTGCRSRLDLVTASLDGRLVFTSGDRQS